MIAALQHAPNAVDVIVVAVLFLGLITGFRQGFIVEVAGILGAILALAAAHRWYPYVRDLLHAVFPLGRTLTSVSYLIVFVVVLAVTLALARKLRLLVRVLLLGGFDRLGGAVVGFCLAAILVELLLFVGDNTHQHGIHYAVRHSVLGPNFLHVVPYVDRLFPYLPAV